MITAKDFAVKLQALAKEQASKLDAVKEYVTVVNTTINSVEFTEPNKDGDIYCRLTVATKLPAYTKKGNLISTNTILLFKNQIISAMAETSKFAVFAKFSYLNEEVEGLQRMSTILCGQPTCLKYVVLDAGDKYVDPATGNVSDKVAAAPCVRYSIASIGEVIKDKNDNDKDDNDSNKNS